MLLIFGAEAARLCAKLGGEVFFSKVVAPRIDPVVCSVVSRRQCCIVGPETVEMNPIIVTSLPLLHHGQKRAGARKRFGPRSFLALCLQGSLMTHDT